MKYEYWFANIKGIGNKWKQVIRSQVASAEELYYIEETALKRIVKNEESRHKILQSVKEWKLEEEYQKLIRKQVELVTIFNSHYPERLKKISSPPYALYVKGELPVEDKLSAAIVGARKCSAYGEMMAKAFAEELARCDVQIISGVARGIDGIAQKAVLDAGGKTFGVLGCGVDICYPREHYHLYSEMQKNGGVISEQPLGMSPLAQFFPARNRIISGLSDIILVIEAKEQSGSLITADMALEQGKDIYALPGNVTSMLSKGCHNLIRQGAGILLSPQEFIEELGILQKGKGEKVIENKISLESAENIVYSCLDFQPQNPSYIFEHTGMEISKILDILVDLELRGYIREVSKNNFVKVK